jgi:2-polyprenyl-3-methyl-5-hydroxy-6-metoxy-1,4-benzoquinol methylase
MHGRELRISGEFSRTTSFRDPAGRLLIVGNRVLRIINKSAENDFDAFLASNVAKKFAAAGSLVRTDHHLDAGCEALLFDDVERRGFSSEAHSLVEHERIPFQSFPYEWSPEMLSAAAHLTLDLAESALAEGFGLKDATPYNILFRGPRPVFVDLLSFERRDERDPIWLAYAQFVRTFLLPLLANQYFGLRLDQLFLTHRDGLEPEEAYRLCSPLRKLSPPFLTLVSIPRWLAAQHTVSQENIYSKRRLDRAKQARYVLERLFKRLRRQLERVAQPNASRSEWLDYMRLSDDADVNYICQKQSFVEDALFEFRPRRVLDVGCNTGFFSRLAVRCGASVVAVDQDPAVIGELWRQSSAESLDILPLVVDLTRPSPSVGWRNRENPSFLNRARGAFDALLMLAVVHHMLVTERIPLEEIIDLAAQVTSDLLIIEFVAPDDPMFRRLARGRDHLFQDLTNETFRGACLKRFQIVRARQLARTSRWIYLLKVK